jgi:hypothetical protein
MSRPEARQYVSLPELMLDRLDYDFIVGAIVERRSSWTTFVREALLEAAQR